MNVRVQARSGGCLSGAGLHKRSEPKEKKSNYMGEVVTVKRVTYVTYERINQVTKYNTYNVSQIYC